MPARSRLRGSSVEDSQQYLTEGGDATARPVSVAGRSLILDSVEQFLELEKLARNGGKYTAVSLLPELPTVMAPPSPPQPCIWCTLKTMTGSILPCP